MISFIYLCTNGAIINNEFMKHLTIRNFGPIKEADFELKRVNLIIGPQSSGKSTVLKVACFCDWMERQILSTQNPELHCNAKVIAESLIRFHKLLGYLHRDTFIRYESDTMVFGFSEEDDTRHFEWKGSQRWNYSRPKIAYIPSERNLVAAIPNWYQVSMNQDNILHFMTEWEFARKAFSNGEPILDLPVEYKYSAKYNVDLIKLPNGHELTLDTTSSGLQSLTPLYLMLRYFTSEYFSETRTSVEQDIMRSNLMKVVANECPDLNAQEQQWIVASILRPNHADLFIEEPEAHIFPSTQKSFVYSLVRMLNSHPKHTCFIATHSPYIMTSFNNVILAGEKAAVDKEKVEEYMHLDQTLRYDEVAAFEMKDGRLASIMDDEFQLISAEALDAASQEISNDFDHLLKI